MAQKWAICYNLKGIVGLLGNNYSYQRSCYYWGSTGGGVTTTTGGVATVTRGLPPASGDFVK